jgi:hypothetical protein
MGMQSIQGVIMQISMGNILIDCTNYSHPRQEMQPGTPCEETSFKAKCILEISIENISCQRYGG